MKTKFLAITVLIIFLVAACQTDSMTDPLELKSSTMKSNFNKIPMDNFSLDLVKLKSSKQKNSSSSIEEIMGVINDEFINQNISIQLGAVEYYSADGTGNTVFFTNRGNKRLEEDFVPGDPRRFPDGNIIAYASDGTEATTSSGLSSGDTDGAIRNAMNTWDNVACSKGLDIVDLGSAPFDLGIVQFLISGGAIGSDLFTDIMHSGYTSDLFTFFFGPNSNVLGVTFSFHWIDGAGNPTDIDNNGKNDTAFRDIYYNDAFPWSNNGTGIDTETVALHEAGHALSQGHFGKLFRTDSNDQFHFAPRAVMNAGYTGIQTTIEKTDEAGHCSNWAQWPNN